MVFFIIIGVVLLVAVAAIGLYNSLVRKKALVDEGWSGIDVQLKRRYDLVPNLVAVVKQYGVHEKEVLERVTQMRVAAMSAQSVDQRAAAEQGLTGALKTLFAVSEQYPDLKANQNFMHLQQELAALEHDLQLARRYYNGAARHYNSTVHSFPANMMAKFFAFNVVPYFEITPEEAKRPDVTF